MIVDYSYTLYVFEKRTLTNMNVSNSEDEDRQIYNDFMHTSMCRDYLRNVCHRGRKCKFLHPTPEDLESLVEISDDDVYEFCHDFQNSQCQRSNCRFIHCTKEKEEQYMATKKMPLKLKLQSDFGISDFGILATDKQLGEKDLRMLEVQGPVCRDFLKRECYRGKKCKFVHLDVQQAALLAADGDIMAGIKRPRMLVSEIEKFDEDCKDYPTFTSSQDVCSFDKHLEEENEALKKRVQELEKQVSDLAATNEVLLEQNAQFRLQKRGLTNYKMESEPLTTTFTPAVGLTSPANLSGGVVANSAPQPVPVHLNVQVANQPPTQEMMSGTPNQPPQGAVVAAGTHLQQVPASVPQSTEIAAQVIAANIAANSVGNVETIQATNRIVSGPMPHSNTLIAPANLNQMPQPAIAVSFAAPMPGHNQLGQQQPMGSFAGAMPNPNQLTQPLGSFTGTMVATPIGGGGAIQPPNNSISVSLAAEVRQPTVGSLGHAVQIQPPAVVYTLTRSTENMSMASTMVSGTGHEITLVGKPTCNPVSSIPGSMHAVAHPVQAFNSVSPVSQAMVQASSHQNTGIPCAPLTSGIAASNTSMPPSVSMGALRPVVQNNLGGSPQVKAAQRAVVQAPSQLNEAALITYPMAPVPPAPMHN